jgi:trimethylamine:corrinoid methyltransferase-like protein
MARRLLAGIAPREDFPARPLLEELLRDGHLLIAGHTRRHLKAEIAFPGPVVDRANRARWQEEGGLTLGQRAAAEVDRLLSAWTPSPLAPEAKRELRRVMEAEARRWGLERLPDAPDAG